jgi:4-amino-4-deoxy-L-arabinose transferase-like glycosyltransferase
MSAERRPFALAVALVVLLAAAAMARPFLPVDETRYLAVAWEMWQRDGLLVPYLNGAPYPHKPPLLFWLLHAGWFLFGVNDLWARVVPMLAALASLALVAALARALWPQRPAAAVAAPLALAPMPLWTYFTGAVMFDMLLAACALLGWLGLALAWRGEMRRGFALAALGIGLGLLAKGPVILLHVLPLAVLAPLWMREARPAWGRWALGTLLATLGGAALVLAWALPAALVGGEAYGQAIFWGQTAGRMAKSFAHRQPFWFYLPFLPLLAAPWVFWPRLWRAARAAGAPGSGERFCLLQIGFALLAFSLISGKQVQYLLPELALIALLAARWADGAPRLVPIALGVGAACLALQLGGAALVGPAHDIAPLAERLAALERRGIPVANEGKYHGQFHYYGRLTRPLEVIDEHAIGAWLNRNPRGRAVVYFREPHYPGPGRVEYQRAYRGQQAAIVAPP